MMYTDLNKNDTWARNNSPSFAVGHQYWNTWTNVFYKAARSTQEVAPLNSSNRVYVTYARITYLTGKVVLPTGKHSSSSLICRLLYFFPYWGQIRTIRKMNDSFAIIALKNIAPWSFTKLDGALKENKSTSSLAIFLMLLEYLNLCYQDAACLKMNDIDRISEVSMLLDMTFPNFKFSKFQVQMIVRTLSAIAALKLALRNESGIFFFLLLL